MKHDIHYISVLVQWGLYEKALSIFEETRTRNDTVPLEAADDCAFLAHKALELHRRGTAYRLAKVFDARFPRHPWAIEAKMSGIEVQMLAVPSPSKSTAYFM